MEWLELEGNYQEVGYQLGKWWGKYIKRLEKKPEGQQFLRSDHGKYKTWLRTGWSDDLLPLFRNAVIHFPELISEIAGMTRGVIDAGLKTSIPAMFALTLGETDEDCSSLTVRSNQGYILGHNEEDDYKYPLCFAKVKLKTPSGTRSFASISHPFQLLGSSAGMTASFAFQGNSIGYAGKEEKLLASWSSRIPKTFFSRKMLEMDSINEIVALFSRHHTTLPNHHYVCFPDAAYSLEIRPKLDPLLSPSNQISVRTINETVDVHTNHFSFNGSIDDNWSWEKKYQKESINREKKLAILIEKERPTNALSVAEVLKDFAPKYPEKTSATLCFDIRKTGVTCEAWYYFEKSHQRLVPLKIHF
ncbi:MAG: hypothetical protein ACHQYP_12500 [Nitrospiria bacterium]